MPIAPAAAAPSDWVVGSGVSGTECSPVPGAPPFPGYCFDICHSAASATAAGTPNTMRKTGASSATV